MFSLTWALLDLLGIIWNPHTTHLESFGINWNQLELLVFYFVDVFNVFDSL